MTLQPIRRYRFDAAILFSDLPMLPWALGQALEYREGEGPVLPPLRDAAALAGAGPRTRSPAAIAPILETVRRVRSRLVRRRLCRLRADRLLPARHSRLPATWWRAAVRAISPRTRTHGVCAAGAVRAADRAADRGDGDLSGRRRSRPVPRRSCCSTAGPASCRRRSSAAMSSGRRRRSSRRCGSVIRPCRSLAFRGWRACWSASMPR